MLKVFSPKIKDEEEQIRMMKKNEELIEEAKKSYSIMIQKLKEDHMMEIKKGRTVYIHSLVTNDMIFSSSRF